MTDRLAAREELYSDWFAGAEWVWRAWEFGIAAYFGYWVPTEWAVYLSIGPLHLRVAAELRPGVVCLPCFDRLATAKGVDISTALLDVQWTGIGKTVVLAPTQLYRYEPASPRAAAAPECPVRKAAQRCADTIECHEVYSGESPCRLCELRRVLAAPCGPLAGPEPSEAAIEAAMAASGGEYDPEADHGIDWEKVGKMLRAAYRAQFGSPPERGTAAPTGEAP